jgi:hypothetical protein
MFAQGWHLRRKHKRGCPLCYPSQVGNWPGSRLDRVLARLRDFRCAVAAGQFGSVASMKPVSDAADPLPLPCLAPCRVVGMTRVGTEPLPGVTYTKAFRNGGSKVLPVLPSDHFGLLLRLEAT